MSIPDFDDLPKVEGMPQGCAWGIFDKEKGKKDLLGTLNLLTPDVVKAASAEVKEGISVSLNWPIDGMKMEVFGRKKPVHNVGRFVNAPATSHIWDDSVEFNTQASSQWDSFCHYLHQPTGLAYNGIACPSPEAFTKATTEEVELPTLDHWHARGGLVARGVLIDYKAYVEETGKAYSPFSTTRITVEEIEAIAKHQGVEFRHGDVFIIRTGWTEALGPLDAEGQQQALMKGGGCTGVHGTVDTAKWFWNKHFAAVASDAAAFETIPPLKEDGTPGNPMKDGVLHPWFLSMFGMPIGELWDLKRLSEVCKQLKRYSFMLTSVPLRVTGLVGSPTNALAIF